MGVAVQIRRAGTVFAPRSVLRGKAELPAVAAARGGWIAVAWLNDYRRGVEAAVIDPRGLVHHATLQRDPVEELTRPAVGIDASGRATVGVEPLARIRAWGVRRHTTARARSAHRVRQAHGRRRPRWPRHRATGRAAGLADSVAGSHAVRPLAAGLSHAGRHRGERGRRPGARAHGRAGPGLPRRRWPTTAPRWSPTRRTPGSASGRCWPSTAPPAARGRRRTRWASAGRLFPDTIGDPNHIPTDIAVAGAVGEDGRAVVAFDADAPDAAVETQGVVAATGTAGGAWSPLRFISLPPALVTPPPVLTLDAAGAPWAVWVESGGGLEESGAVRGARLVGGRAGAGARHDAAGADGAESRRRCA